jgi:hypothetical protein
MTQINPATQYSYDYQPVQQDGLSTLEAGLAANNTVEVTAGDMVYNVNGEPEELAAGTLIKDAEGNEIDYDGSSTVQMPQLTVTYLLKPYTWSDGTPGSIADVELAFKTNCDRDSGAVSYITCDAIQSVEYGEGLEYTVTYLPGMQSPTYYLVPFSFDADIVYPSHLVLSDGRNLADVRRRSGPVCPRSLSDR